MSHHSHKHLHCSVAEDYPNKAFFKSLFVSFLLQQCSSQWCPQCPCSHFKQALPLGQSLHSRLSLPPAHDPNTQKANNLADAGHHCSPQSSVCCIRGRESGPLAVPASLPGSGAGGTLPAFSGEREQGWRKAAGSSGPAAGPAAPLPSEALRSAACLSCSSAARCARTPDRSQAVPQGSNQAPTIMGPQYQVLTTLSSLLLPRE